MSSQALVFGLIAAVVFLIVLSKIILGRPLTEQPDSALERLKSLYLKNQQPDKYLAVVREQERRSTLREHKSIVDTYSAPDLQTQAQEMAQRTMALLDETMRTEGVTIDEAHEIISKRLRERESALMSQGMNADAASEKAFMELYGLDQYPD